MKSSVQSLSRLLLSSTLLCGVIPSMVLAAPQDGVVASGAATITTNGATTLIQQSTDRTAIDWRSFDVKANEAVVFQQPSSTSIALNRINDQKPSEIFGSISANGQIILSNPSGMIFGKGSRVDVAGLVATTADISNSAFMNNAVLGLGEAGRTNGKIINNGTITAKDAGLIALVAPQVENNGFIGARLGKVQLGGADTFTVDMYGDGLINMAVKDSTLTSVTNTGVLRARAGNVLLSAAQAEQVLSSTVNLTGTVDVSASRTDKTGTIIFGDGVGGDVTVTGDHIALHSDAHILASGPNGGGQVHIGGGYQGKGPLPWAKTTTLEASTRIAANATVKGNGGEVVLWSKDTTLFDGVINARGGKEGGNGGTIETSSKNTLGVLGFADASAPKGLSGDWLLDPTNITITQAGGTDVTAGACGAGPYACTDISVSANSIQTALSGNNVTIQATGNITLSTASITKNSASNQNLTLKAEGSILTTGTNSITGSGAGKLNVTFWADAETVPNNSGMISLINTTINTNGGDVVMGGGLDDGTDSIAYTDGTTVLYNAAAGDGRPDGFAWGVANGDEGVILDNTQVTTGSGGIYLHGHGKNSATSDQYGVSVTNGSILDSNGLLLLDGTGGDNAAFGVGVFIKDATTQVRSATGNIFLNGLGGSAVNSDQHGVVVQAASVYSSDTATVSLYGKAGALGTFSYGDFVQTNATVSSVHGALKLIGAGGTGANGMGIRLSSGSSISSNSDANITLDGTKSSGASSSDFRFQTLPAVTIGGVNATGVITFVTNLIGTFQDVTVQTQGNIVFKPRTAGSTIGISGGTCGSTCNVILTDAILATLNPDVDGNGVGSLIIGDAAAGTGIVDINGWDVSGKTYDVEVYGGQVDLTGGITWNGPNDLLFHSRTNNLIIDQDFTRSAGTAGTGKLTLKASGNITSSGTHTITAANPVNTILWSNSDNAGGGFINLVTTAFTTGGGFFVAGGGLDDGADIANILGATIIDGTAGDGIPDGAAAGNAGNNTGVEFDNVDINSGDGYIQMVGQGRNNAGGSGEKGISIVNDSRIESAAGNITLSGTGGAGTGTNYGFTLQDAGTILTSTNGNIVIDGRATGTTTFNYGVDIRNAPQITTGNNGNITITGRGADGTSENRGFHITGTGSKIEVVDGDISITGIGGNGASTGNKGIVVASGSLISSTGTGVGAGTITLNGTGGTGTGNSYGFDISGVTGGNIQSTRGAVQITGVGGTGGSNNHGINIATSSTIGLTGSASSAPITLTGTRGDVTAGTVDINMNTGPIILGDALNTGNITINADTVSLAAMNAYTQNNIIIKPRTVGTSIGISGGTCGGTCTLDLNDTVLAMLHPDDDANGTGSLIIGDSAAGTGTVDIAGWDISGKTYDVEVYGGLVDFTTGAVTWDHDNSLLFNSRTNNIVIDQDFTRNAGTAGDGTLTFKASGNITSSGTHSISTAAGAASGKLTSIFWADAEAAPNNDGMISLIDLTVGTNGGDVIMGGGLDDGSDIISVTDGTTVLYNGIAADGRPDGYAWGNGTSDEGIALNNVDVLTGSGAITMRGHGRNSATGNQNGVYILNTSLIKSDSNSILIDGKGGNAGTSNFGINISDANTIVRSTTGSITLNGGGGDSTGDFNYGIFVQSGALIDSDGTAGTAAPITFLGKGGTAGASNNNYGVSIFTGSTISSRDGDITMTGVGGSGATVNNGFRLNNSAISSNGDANITITGQRGDNGAGDFDIGGGTITVGGANATGTISFIGNTINTFANTTAQTQNNIIFKPRTEPTTVGVSGGTCGGSCTLQLTDAVIAQLHPDVDGNGTGTLVIGDVADAAGTVDIAGWDISGQTYDVEVYGGLIDFTTAGISWNRDNSLLFQSRTNDMVIDQDFTRNAGTAGDGTLTLKASGSIDTSGVRTISAATAGATGKLHTILWSDAEAVPTSDGFIRLTNTTLTTNGGDVVLGGGRDNGANSGVAADGRPDEYVWGNATVDDGITLNNGDITAGIGSIRMLGHGRNNAASNQQYGISITNGSLITTTGEGSVTLLGQGGNGTDDNYGIYTKDAGTIIRTVDGDISLTGTSGGTGRYNRGVEVSTSSTIQTTGIGASAGNITIMGTGATGADQKSHGFELNGGTITVDEGDILIHGDGATNSTGWYGGGINTVGGVISSTGIGNGAGNITIQGVGGTGGVLGDEGIRIGWGTQVRTVDGDILITGTGQNTQESHGVWVNWGAKIISTGTGANAGNISISGTGGNGVGSNGVWFGNDGTNTYISSVDGDVTLNGVTGSATGYGIQFTDEADILTTGDANITLTGTAGAGSKDLYFQTGGGGTATLGGATATGTISLIGNTLVAQNLDAQTTNDIVIKPRTEPTTVGISGGACGGTCTLNITDAILGMLHPDVDANGTGTLVIGDVADAAGIVDINGWNLSGTNYDVDVYGGTVDFTGAMAWNGSNDLTFNSRTGNLDIDQTFTKSGGGASGLRFNAAGAITQTSAITSSSGAINLAYDSDRDSAGGETITLSANSTTLGGTIDVNDNAILGTNVALSSGAGDITFVGTLNGAHNLDITTTSDIVFGGIVGGSTRLAAVTVTGGDTVVATNFNAASYTQTGGTGAISFANGGLNTTGNTDITTTGAILGTYTGANGKLYSNGAVNATVTFNALDIKGTSATLLAGNIGAPGVADQTMANLISINGVSSPTLVANPAYTFAGFTIGALAAPPAGGGSGGGAGSGGGTGVVTPPPGTGTGGGAGSGGGSSGGGTGSGSGSTGGYDGSVPFPVYLEKVLGEPLFNTEVVARDQVFGAMLMDEFNNGLSGTQDFQLAIPEDEGFDLNMNDRDLEKEIELRLKTPSAGEKQKKTNNALYRYSPSLWRILHSS